MKNKVFKSLVNDLVDLNTRIETVIKGISKKLLEDAVIDSNGAHLQNVFKK